MKRKDLEELGLEKEVVDKIMELNGDSINNLKLQIKSLESDKKSLESQIKQDDGVNWKEKYEVLDAKVKQDEADKKAKEENEILEKSILESLGNKKFSSDYVKKGILEDVKAELNKSENKGKGVKEILDILTKDKEGIFENPNKPADMPPAGDGNNNSTSGAEGFVSIVKEFQR